MPDHFIPYGRQYITDDDIRAVTKTLESNYLTQGPSIQSFENDFAGKTNAKYACAVSSATAALHIAYQALDICDGDIVWTCPNTFVATANAARYLNAKIDFVDIELETFCMSVEALKEKLEAADKKGSLPKLVVPVHFGGVSCDMKSIHALSKQYGFKVVEDASHCVGATYDGNPVGACQYSDMAVFSFHPVKIITTGEGGMITTNDQTLFDKVMMGRTHGITKDPSMMNNKNPDPWEMEQHFLGFNYRMTDIQAALGQSQLSRLDDNMDRRRAIAKRYREAFDGMPIQCQSGQEGAISSYHLFPVLFENSDIRRDIYDYLKQLKIGTQVHYIPVHIHPYYEQLGFNKGDFARSEDYYSRCLSIPMYHGLTEEEQDYVITRIQEFFKWKTL